MVVTKEDFEEMNIEFHREVRTQSSEEYIIASSDTNSGPAYARGGHILGKAIIQFTDTTLSQKHVSLFLVFESEWTENALDGLVTKVDYQLIDGWGTGLGDERASFYVDSYVNAERIDTRRSRFNYTLEHNIHEAKRGIDEAQQSIETLPLALSETIHAAVDEQYQNIEDIIESDIDSDEKKERISEKVRYGIERGMPTFVYDRERETEE